LSSSDRLIRVALKISRSTDGKIAYGDDDDSAASAYGRSSWSLDKEESV
jgi:hypothetical protein